MLPTIEDAKLEKCRRSFPYFLNYWHFVNRESGKVMDFSRMWESQEIAAREMQEHEWLFLLKAGKLGATELECAFDGWRARFGNPNSRVHIFSLGYESAKELLKIVRFGLESLPDFMRWPVGREVSRLDAGLDTSREFVVANPQWPNADRRKVVSYPVVKNVSIDQTCQHAHLDELSHIPIAKELWNGVVSTVAPSGTCHVVSRGAGEQVFTAELWARAVEGSSPVFPLFIPWHTRPDRDRAWYETQASTLTPIALRYFAPETAQDALASPEENVYIPVQLWDLCEDTDLPALGAEEPVVVSLDAATHRDTFHMAVISRYHKNIKQACLREAKNWNPKDQPGGKVNHMEVERYIKEFCQTHNVVQICYDPFQLEPMKSRCDEEGWAWMKPFSQTSERSEADTRLRNLILRREFHHNGDQVTREHIKNARALVDKAFPDKVRIIRDREAQKVDGAVATAMGVQRVLELNLG